MKKYSLMFLTGGTLYAMIEILWRKYTHISMFFAGGCCMVLIHGICNQKLKSKPHFIQYLSGSAIITTVEFVAGLIVNKKLQLNVWDYSCVPGNIMGQICPIYSIFWFFLTIPAMGLCHCMDRLFATQKRRLAK